MRLTASRAAPVSASSMAALNWRSSVSTSCWSYICLALSISPLVPVTRRQRLGKLYEPSRKERPACGGIKPAPRADRPQPGAGGLLRRLVGSRRRDHARVVLHLG